jgi:uncharacterized protein (DUF2267 family)
MKKDEFLSRVQAAGALPDRRAAEQWSRAVASALAQLSPTPEGRRHFLTQLPGFLKTQLLSETPRPLVMDREAFLQHVGAALGAHAPEAQRALLVVWGVLKQAVSAGEIEDFEAYVPKDIAALLERAA